VATREVETTLPDRVAGDTTPPPAPTVIEARAFVRTSPLARVVERGSAVLRRADAACVYLELGNVELGTSLQLLNLSARPDARWDDGQPPIALEVTGRDPRQRHAALFVDEEACGRLDLRAGDVLQLRAVDRAGNASPAVTAQIVPAAWARQQLRDRQGQRWVEMRGDTLRALDGEAQRRDLPVAAVADARPPVLLPGRLRLVPCGRFSDDDRALARALLDASDRIAGAVGSTAWTAATLRRIANSSELPGAARSAAAALAMDPARLARFDGAWQQAPGEPSGVLGRLDLQAVLASHRGVRLQGEGAAEPRSTIEVQNQRSGRVWLIRVPDDRCLDYELDEVLDGDPLLLRPRDAQGQAGEAVELVHDASRPDGCASPEASALGRPLSGVLGDD
jgi:hypothetical protein